MRYRLYESRIKTIKKRFVSLTAALVLAVTSLSSAAPLFLSQKALAIDSTTTVNPSSTAGWSFKTTGDATGAYSAEPATQILGVGSYELKSTSGKKGYLYNGNYSGALLSSLSDLSYSYYISSHNTGSKVAPSLSLITVINGTWTELKIEPTYTTDNPSLGAWHTLDAFSPTTKWYSTKPLYTDISHSTVAVHGGDSVANMVPWTTLVGLDSGAILGSDDGASGVRFTIGQNSGGAPWSNLDSYVDKVVVNTTTYNFEPAPPAAPSGLYFTKNGSTTNLVCGAVVNSFAGMTLHWVAPSGTLNKYAITPNYPNNSGEYTYYPGGTSTSTWIGDNFGQHEQGTYSYAIKAQNTNGQWGAATACNIIYDTVAPVVTVTPVAGSLLHGTETFKVTVTDDNLNLSAPSTWVYLYNSGTPYKSKGASVNLSSGHGTFTVDTTLLNDGDTWLDVGKLYDAAGNPSGVTDTYFAHYTIDNTMPVVTIDGNAPKSFYNNSTSINVHVSDDNYVKTDIYHSGASSPFKTYTGAYFGLFWLDDGDYHIVATDAVGNSVAYDFTIDKTAPTVNFVSTTPTENGHVRGTITAHVQATDNIGMGSYYIRVWKGAFESGISNLVYNSCSSAPGGTALGTSQDITCSVDTSSWSDGTYVMSAQFLDGGSNWGKALRTIYVDNTAPVMSNIKMYVNGNETTLAKSGDSVTIKADVTDPSNIDKIQIWVRNFANTSKQLTSGILTHGTGDSYSFTFIVPATYQDGSAINENVDGNYFNFRPYDTLGNSVIAYRNNFTIDNTKPDAPTASPAPGIYPTLQTITLADTDSTAAIYYTTDGSTPDATSTPYIGAFTVSSSKTVKAIAYDNAGNPSSVLTAEYTITGGVVEGASTTTPQQAAPNTFAVTSSASRILGSSSSNSDGTSTDTTTTDEAPAGEVKAAETQRTLTSTDNKSDTTKNSNFLGLGWWWLAVLAVLLGFFWFLLGKRDERSDK